MNSEQLDEWDFRLIDLAKSLDENTQNEARILWAKRCGLELDQAHLGYVVWHLARLMDRLKIVSIETLLERANPHRFEPLFTGETNFIKQWFNVLMSVLCTARIDDIPGYRAWLETTKGSGWEGIVKRTKLGNVLETRVKLGAALLDEKYPNWYKHISVSRLNMSSMCNCVLGQLYGDYQRGKTKLNLIFGPVFGFDGEQGTHLKLRELWKKEIRDRRYASMEITTGAGNEQ